MRRSVVVAAKAPEPGRAKTRLAASIGDEAASALAAAFIIDVTTTVASLGVRCVLAWAGDEHHSAFSSARALGYHFCPQSDGDLGRRLDAIINAEAEHADTIIVIGSDSPTLMPIHFEEAWAALETHDVVIGPSFDGGYYLLGVNSAWFRQTRRSTVHPLFADITWSTRHVLGQTIRHAREIGALCDLIRFCYDVDTLEDLDLLKIHLLEHLRPSGLDVAQNTAILLSNTPTD